MKIVHDWLGEVLLPDSAQRIISLAPNVTDALYALGLGEKLVGRSAFCYRPQAVNALPVIASYTKVRWDLLESLKPDLVLISTGVQRPLLGELHKAGLPVFPVPLPQSPYGILENLILIGELLGIGEWASKLTMELSSRYQSLAGALPPIRTYLEFDLGGPITVGRGSYVGEALRHLGLVNVYAHHPQSYFAPDLAELPLLEPGLVIYEPKPNRSRGEAKARELVASRQWSLPLVVTGGDELAHYGPLFFQFLEKLARQIKTLLENKS